MNQILAALIGYVFGSVPFGLLLTKAAGLGDVRSIGSGNIGATNVLRTGNKAVAAATLLCDILKGTIPVLIAAYYWDGNAALIAAFGAMAGHIFPGWLGFKGGKGVATLIGVLFGLYWPLAVIFICVWVIVATAMKYSSLAALVSSALLPIWAWGFGRGDLVLWLVVLTVIVWITHKANILRLISRTESQISFGSKK